MTTTATARAALLKAREALKEIPKLPSPDIMVAHPHAPLGHTDKAMLDYAAAAKAPARRAIEQALAELPADEPIPMILFCPQCESTISVATIESLTRDRDPRGKTILDFVYLWRDQAEDRARKAETALAELQGYIRNLNLAQEPKYPTEAKSSTDVTDAARIAADGGVLEGWNRTTSGAIGQP